MRNFFDAAQLDQLIDDFIQRKWMVSEKHTDTNETVIRLTAEGKKAYSEILSTQQQTRMQLVQGITKEEYETTISVLKRLVANSKS